LQDVFSRYIIRCSRSRFKFSEKTPNDSRKQIEATLASLKRLLAVCTALGEVGRRQNQGEKSASVGELTMKGTLLEGIPVELPEEIFDTLCSTDNVRIERIVSRGHASPEGFWYDQENNEFILIVQGSAGLRLENESDIMVLKTGDYLNIGAHVKHRVEWTDPAGETIWLAVYY
jgi:cupin 2 domain-containing protein